MFELMQNAFLASVFISIAVGVIGSFILVNRFGFLAASIAHGSYGGIGAGVYFGVSILLATSLSAVFLALLLAFISFYYKHRSDTLIGVIWAVGMSAGIIFTDLSSGYNVDLMSYLFGNILMVPKGDLYFMLFVDILLVVAVYFLYNHLVAISYDSDFALLRGVRVKLLYTLLLIFIALTVVMSVRAIGLILVIALFTIPPFIAEKFTKNFRSMMFLSAVLSLVFCVSGLYLSYYLDISATPAIIICASLVFFVSFLVKI